MTNDLGTYTFLPWARQGIANRIDSADGDPSVTTRAAVTVDLDLKGSGGEDGDVTTRVTRPVALYGPGDIVGIETEAIIRHEPLDWITNFEPNYLPFVEFYDEDLPYRYTPAAPDGGRLRPWISLVVLTETEFREGGNVLGKPLPFIEITANPMEGVFPPADELWAWAHVHVNQNLAGSGVAPQAPDIGDVLTQLDGLLATSPDTAYSRLLCPRRLAPNTGYHAFVVPTFEAGRLAGLGRDPAAAAHATASAWGPGRDVPTLMPFYFRWYFRTGAEGDFEYLVRLLQPRPADERVGRRDLDVQRPGSNLAGITDPELDGVLKLGGALLAPLSDEATEALEPWERWDEPYPHAFQTDLAAFVNLAEDYARLAADAANGGSGLDPAISADPDPLITPPIYGRWHSLTSRLLTDPDRGDVPNNRKWVHQLNLDPRWRSAAGFGTDVVVANQEAYMDAAWSQVGSVIEANRRIRLAQLATLTSAAWYRKHLVPLRAAGAAAGAARVTVATAPLQRRVMNGGFTVFHQARHSAVTRAVTSGQMRRVLRPRARVHRLAGFAAPSAGDPGGTPAAAVTSLVTKVNDAEVTAAPPNTVPPDLQTVEDVAAEMLPDGAAGAVFVWLRRWPWLRFVPLAVAAAALVAAILLLLVGVPAPVWAVVLAVAAVMVYAWRRLADIWRAGRDAESIVGANQTPESVDELPSRGDFVLTPAVDLTDLDPRAPPQVPTGGGADSVEAARFKTALAEAYTTVQVGRAAGTKPAVQPLALGAVADATLAALDPAVTIPRFVMGTIVFPSHIIDLIGEQFTEAMAYPELDVPMYKPLVNRSVELFVPNLRLIEQNTITLLNTNQRFIEAYMVGLNHEFARELLWREYPTDQRGSYFRQFWDVSTFLSTTSDDAQRREELKDVPPLHLWSRLSELGDHDHREQGLESEEELVLVIRGELLKKYPNAVIYAHRAMWQPTSDTDPTPDKTTERVFDPDGPVKTPLYEAKVHPDVYFFGFDLVEDEARGDDTVDDEPGWFFVIKERPGEPRFGFDIERDGDIQVWNDLAWDDVVPGVAPGDFVELASAPAPSLPAAAPGGEDQEKAEQWAEDRHLQWTAAITSAELAYIMFQAPVLVGVHAAEMLPES